MASTEATEDGPPLKKKCCRGPDMNMHPGLLPGQDIMVVFHDSETVCANSAYLAGITEHFSASNSIGLDGGLLVYDFSGEALLHPRHFRLLLQMVEPLRKVKVDYLTVWDMIRWGKVLDSKPLLKDCDEFLAGELSGHDFKYHAKALWKAKDHLPKTRTQCLKFIHNALHTNSYPVNLDGLKTVVLCVQDDVVCKDYLWDKLAFYLPSSYNNEMKETLFACNNLDEIIAAGFEHQMEGKNREKKWEQASKAVLEQITLATTKDGAYALATTKQICDSIVDEHMWNGLVTSTDSIPLYRGGEDTGDDEEDSG